MEAHQSISATGLELLDHTLLLQINGWHHPLFDWLMSVMTHSFFWIWLYLIIFLAAYKWGGVKGAAFVLMGALVTFTITDLTSVHAFKNVFERYRPCHNLYLKDLVHLPFGRCGGQFGFVSSHAANTGGIMAFIIASGFFKNQVNLLTRRLIYGLLLFYFITNCYSRMYLGIHYPSDIIAGGMLGISSGVLIAYLMRKIPVFRAFTKKNLNP